MSTSATKPSVLVVDDEPAARLLLCDHLTADGYTVVEADRVDEALHRLGEGPVSVIITDWLMPERDGLELCRIVREHDGFGPVYIIVLTIQDTRDKLVEALDAGADDYLTKPFNRPELLARVRVGVRSVQMQDALASRVRSAFLRNAQLACLAQRLTTLASTDGLTGLLNRREALAQFEGLWAVARIQNDPLSCIIIDIDHFKRINDTYGHPAGDLVLRNVADVLQRTCRRQDLVARLGGEEFLIVCAHTTCNEASELAERIRQATATPVDTGSATIHVTVSLGVAQASRRMRAPDDLLNSADAALYEAKNAGRDRVMIA